MASSRSVEKRFAIFNVVSSIEMRVMRQAVKQLNGELFKTSKSRFLCSSFVRAYQGFKTPIGISLKFLKKIFNWKKILVSTDKFRTQIFTFWLAKALHQRWHRSTKFGKIISIASWPTRIRVSRGICFVRFDTKYEADRAVQRANRDTLFPGSEPIIVKVLEKNFYFYFWVKKVFEFLFSTQIKLTSTNTKTLKTGVKQTHPLIRKLMTFSKQENFELCRVETSLPRTTRWFEVWSSPGSWEQYVAANPQKLELSYSHSRWENNDQVYVINHTCISW